MNDNDDGNYYNLSKFDMMIKVKYTKSFSIFFECIQEGKKNSKYLKHLECTRRSGKV